MSISTRIMTVATAVVGMIGLGTGSASADSGNGGTVALGPTYRSCDFSQIHYVSATGDASATAVIGTGGTNTVTADVFLMIGIPNTAYQVRLIQGPRPGSQMCNPGAPGVASAVLNTDGNGVGRVTLHDALQSGATKRGCSSKDRPSPARSAATLHIRHSDESAVARIRRIRWKRLGSTGFGCRECYLLAIAMRWAALPLYAPATRTVSTPASYDAEIASPVTCAGSRNDRRNEP